MSRYVSIEHKYYDLGSGSLDTDPIAMVPAVNGGEIFIYSAEALLQDLESHCKDTPLVIWFVPERTAKMFDEAEAIE